MLGGALGEWRLGRRETLPAGEVAYEVFGEGPPVVLIHGTPSNSYLWRRVVPVLADRFSVYVYDLLGFGESERGEGLDVSIRGQARLLGELISAWGLDRGDEAPAVAGHDIGGGVALRAHLLEGVPFRSIALLDAVVLTPWGTPALKHVKEHLGAYTTMPSGLFEAIVEKHLEEAVSLPLERGAFETYLSHWRGEEGKLAYVRKDAQLEERDTAELEPLLGSVEVPVRVVWGSEDGWLDPAQIDRLAEAIPGASLTKVPGAGHFVMEDAPEKVAQELLAFFSTNEDRT